MFAEDDLLPISALQHLLFCRRQARFSTAAPDGGWPWPWTPPFRETTRATCADLHAFLRTGHPGRHLLKFLGRPPHGGVD